MRNYAEEHTLLPQESLRILGVVQKNAPVTKADLARLCGYRMSTLNRYLDPLLRREIVASCGVADSSGGRRPALLDIRENRLCVLGVNIATMYMEVMLVNLKVQILSKERFDLPAEMLPEQAVRLAWESARQQMKRLGIARGRVLGIGLSSIGPFDTERGVILPPIVRHLRSEWIGYPIRDRLEEVSGFPVAADIGANNAAVVEYLFGHGRGRDKLLCVRCGMSIKTAYIVSSVIVRTTNNAEDAFGHMTVDMDGPRCVCGNHGCIECYAAIPAILAHFRAERKKGRQSIVDKRLEDIRYLDVLAAADAGDALAAEIVIQASTVLGAGLANYINLLNPDVVAMDGPIIHDCALYYENAVAVATMKSRLLNGGVATVFARNSKFEDPSTVGAAVLVMEKMLFSGAGMSDAERA